MSDSIDLTSVPDFFELLLHEDLSSGEVFRGLVDYGLFGEKIPPCFSSEGLWKYLCQDIEYTKSKSKKSLKNLVRERTHDFIRYESLRHINIPRQLGVPHPESYAFLAQVIAENWSDISAHCSRIDFSVSRIQVRRIYGKKAIFKMNYKGDERWSHEEQSLRWQAGARYRVAADVSSCFPSIYTHSLPWALHGKAVAKQNRLDLKALLGNLLDKCAQMVRDGQTNGLLIGPHASNILSEIILTEIDVQLIDKGFNQFYRHIDDYTFYAKDRGEAELFIRQLGLFLREYEMSLNEKKTQIIRLPESSETHWVSALNRFVFQDQNEDNEIGWSSVKGFLDLALELSEEFDCASPITYAIKRVPYSLTARAQKMFLLRSFELVLARPYLSQVLSRYLIPRFREQVEELGEDLEDFATKLCDLGIDCLYTDAVSYSLYFALSEGKALRLTEEQLLRIIELKDCLSLVLLLIYSKKHQLENVQHEIEEFAQLLRSHFTTRADRDQYWLLIFETWTVSQLKDFDQLFLSNLKESGFSFIRF